MSSEEENWENFLGILGFSDWNGYIHGIDKMCKYQGSNPRLKILYSWSNFFLTKLKCLKKKINETQNMLNNFFNKDSNPRT